MKKLYISISTCLLLFTTSCTITHKKEAFDINVTNKKSLKENLFLVDGGRGKGGNPEVKTINQCFKLKNKALNRCLNIFYPENINITIYPATQRSIELIASRGSSIEEREFNLGGEDRFILHLDTSKILLPVHCNIKTAKLSQERSSLIVDITVKDIETMVTLYDKNNQVILNYKIKKD